MTSAATSDRAERKRTQALAWKRKNLLKVRKADKDRKRKKREKSREEYNNSMREYRAKTPEIKIRTLLTVAKNRAKLKGLAFDVSISDIELPTHCPLLGLELNYAASGNTNPDNGVSLDRIEPAKGYVSGNVWVISYRANRIKNNATAEELRMIADNLDKKMMENGDE